jgi:hypothetical protein
MTFSAVVLALSICGLSPSAVCSCISRPPISTERDAAAVAKEFDVIFDGTVTSVIADTVRFGRRATLAVQRQWGPVGEDTVVVSTGLGDGDCGFEFKTGERYLIFARSGRTWHTNICTPSRAWDAEAARLAGLLGPATRRR